MKYILPVFIGGGIGAVLRYSFTSYLFNSPLATFSANMLGCFLIGFSMPYLLSKTDSMWWRMFFVTGFLGGLTTFSTFTYETLLLFEKNSMPIAALNIAANLIGGLLLALLGIYIMQILQNS